MPGTQTKFLAALMLLINALVLLNIRRAGPELPHGVYSRSCCWCSGTLHLRKLLLWAERCVCCVPNTHVHLGAARLGFVRARSYRTPTVCDRHSRNAPRSSGLRLSKRWIVSMAHCVETVPSPIACCAVSQAIRFVRFTSRQKSTNFREPRSLPTNHTCSLASTPRAPKAATFCESPHQQCLCSYNSTVAGIEEVCIRRRCHMSLP